MRFNSPPNWPQPPAGWVPPPHWQPDPSWPAPPAGWELWVDDTPKAESSAAGSTAPTAPVENPGEPMCSTEPDSADSASAELIALRHRVAELESELAIATTTASNPGVDERELQDAGIYRYHHPLENAAAYLERLSEINARIDATIKSARAVLASDHFTFDGSLAKGRRMTSDLSKLMLRAYNAEAENCVRTLRSGNITLAKRRLERAVAAIERLGVIMEIRVNPEYHLLRIEELELTADYQMRVQEEKQQAREERELLREQRRAEQELAAERERLDKERAHYESALQQLRASGDSGAVAVLESRLVEIADAIDRNDYRIANIRAGYIYVISNIGALGPNVVKIGMTRRLEPRDRVRELGDASVPFLYDTHALFFSDDAVTLENELHRHFADRRVNLVNERREFFFTTPAEVRDVLLRKVGGGLLEFCETPEAAEYHQSRGQWPNTA